MRKPSPLKAVRSRRKEIALLIEELRKEDADLETTERVLVKMEGGDVGQPSLNLEMSADGKKRLKGTKTVGEYILDILEFRYMLDEPPITAPDLLAELKRKYLPELARTSFSPPLSRLVAQKRVIKDGNTYRVPEKETAPKGAVGDEADDLV